MPQVLVTESSLEAIGDAIRYKNGSQNTYTPSQMAPAIRAITTAQEGYVLPEGTMEITQNGTYDVTLYEYAHVNFAQVSAQEGMVVLDANGMLIFSPESGLSYQTKTATPSTSTQTITPDSGYVGLSSVTVNPIPSNYIDSSNIITYYTSSAAPTSSDGSNGDIWLITSGS